MLHIDYLSLPGYLCSVHTAFNGTYHKHNLTVCCTDESHC